MIPIRDPLPDVTFIRDGRQCRGNVVYLWGGPYEKFIRCPHESPVHRATPARVIRLPDLSEFTHDEVRDMARKAFREERARMRTTMMKRKTLPMRVK